MATFTYAFCTINQVLKNGGEMEFSELARVLTQQDPRRFRDEKTVEMAVVRYTDCLRFGGRTVSFDRNAKKYAKFGIMERDIQAALHESIPNMDEWALYPFKTRKNSNSCYLGIPWEEIPKDPDEGDKYNINYPIGCDFRAEGEDTCRSGCRVSEDVLKRYGIM